MFLNRLLTTTIAFAGFVLAAAVFSGSAAQARPNTTDYSCSGVRDFIDQRGTVVMNTKNRFVYRKFYAPHYQCSFSTIHTPYDVPTKSGMCTLFICREPRDLMFDRFN
uniref:hypothetical protein n=1 Tax=Pararhizobium sp. IMCC3301 TaxID=3067904 RepID=UPI002741250E|nr:hypothetical protein [Pararhizobium sp. IMCC3301]